MSLAHSSHSDPPIRLAVILVIPRIHYNQTFTSALGLKYKYKRPLLTTQILQHSL